MSSSKLEAYAELVAARKQCVRCVGLANPAHCCDGAYDSAEIGPWTRWQGALDAELMLIGQDWGDVAYFEKHAGTDRSANPTNRRLRELLAEAGFDIEEADQATGRGLIFLTNAILCLKTGGMGAQVRSAWFNECGPRFLRPQIELVRPRALVPLGERAYRAVCRAFGHRPIPFRQAVEESFAPEILEGVKLFPVYHCSPRVLAATRVMSQQRADWRRIGVALGRNPVNRGASRHIAG